MSVRSFQRSAVSFSIDVLSAGTETDPTKTIDRHTGRGKTEIRYPGSSCFFWIPDIRLRRIPE